MSDRPGQLEVIVSRLLAGKVMAKVTLASGRVEFFVVNDYLRLPMAYLLGSKVQLVEVPE